MELGSIWFLSAYLATLLFSTMAAAFTTRLRVDSQAFEGDQKGVLARIHEHWPRELALTMLLYPFMGMAATLVLGALNWAPLAAGHGGRTLLLERRVGKGRAVTENVLWGGWGTERCRMRERAA